jgi:Lon protease-like protein
MTRDTLDTLGLFPLHTVLLPGAALSLKVFEARYLDLVRDCSHHGRGFGVCVILRGEEVGAPATAAAYGTEAVIEDFGQTAQGLLTLRVRGARRFHVERARVRDNGLQVAQVRWCTPEVSEPVGPEHGLLPVLLEAMVEKIGGEHAQAPRTSFDDAAWVSWRLAELLPLHDTQRQELLQLDDPHARLDRLLELVS